MRKLILPLIVLVVLAAVSFAYAEVPADVATWANMIKGKYDGTTITCAFVPHPTTDAMQAMVDEFTQLTGIK